MKSNYRDIKTLEELDEAIERNRLRIEKKGESIQQSLSSAEKFYTPQNLLTQGIRRAALNINFYSNALALVRSLRKQLEK